MLYIGADHRGYNLKEEIKKFLEEKGIKFNDVGNLKYDQDDDYPDFAKKVSIKVASNIENKGILICGSGVGMSIVANKFKGIRAGLCLSGYMAKEARQAIDINILCLSADLTDTTTAKSIVREWLDAIFKKEDRYLRRVKKIDQLLEN